MEAKLIVLQGADPMEIELFLPFLIGRSADAALRIPHESVSREHCRIYEFDGELAVRDLGSRSGTYVNGQRIDRPAFLSPGDELTVGGITFRAEYQIRRQVVLIPHGEVGLGQSPPIRKSEVNASVSDATVPRPPAVPAIASQADNRTAQTHASSAAAQGKTQKKPAAGKTKPVALDTARIVRNDPPETIPNLGLPPAPLVDEFDLQTDEPIEHVAEDELNDFFEGIG